MQAILPYIAWPRGLYNIARMAILTVSILQQNGQTIAIHVYHGTNGIAILIHIAIPASQVTTRIAIRTRVRTNEHYLKNNLKYKHVRTYYVRTSMLRTNGTMVP